MVKEEEEEEETIREAVCNNYSGMRDCDGALLIQSLSSSYPPEACSARRAFRRVISGAKFRQPFRGSLFASHVAVSAALVRIRCYLRDATAARL